MAIGNRIIHVLPSLARESSGPGYSVRRLCESLIDFNNQITLATLEWGPLNDPPTFLKSFPLGWGSPRLGRSPDMKRWLDKEVLSGEVTVLHNHGMWQMNAVYPGWVTKSRDIQYVSSPRGTFSQWAMQHGSRSKALFWPLLQKPSLEAVSCFHATCNAEYLDIRRLGFKQPIAIIPNGIDLPELRKQCAAKKYRTLLFLGRLHSVKGVDILLTAWRSVQDLFTDWRLVIAGSDVDYHGKSRYLFEMTSLARQLGVKRVEFVGEIVGVEKFDLYQSAELYVLPSRSENFAITVAESLASGTPVIVSKAAPWGGLEVYNAGWWIDIGVDPLIKCLTESLAHTPKSLARRGHLGRHWMETAYSWSHVASRMNETYMWLTRKIRSRPEWVHEY